MKIIITENQFKKLFLNENFLINEITNPLNILDDLIKNIKPLSTRTGRGTIGLSDELKTAFNISTTGNLKNLVKKLEDIKNADQFLEPNQIKSLYNNFKTNRNIDDIFTDYFTKNENTQRILRAYRKAIERNDTSKISKFKDELEKFMPTEKINGIISKLPDEASLVAKTGIEFLDYKNRVRKLLLKKNGKEEISKDILSNKYNFTSDQWAEIEKMAGYSRPKSFEFKKLVDNFNPTSDGDFIKYLESNGFITEDDWRLVVRYYGASISKKIPNALKKFLTHVGDNKAAYFIIGSLISAGIFGIVKLLIEYGFMKTTETLKKDDSYTINRVREFLSSEKPLVGGYNLKNIPNNQLEGQEIKVINADNGLISLDPGLYVNLEGELITNFIWDDILGKLTPKASIKPSKTSEEELIKKEVSTFESFLKPQRGVSDSAKFSFDPKTKIYTINDPIEGIHEYEKNDEGKFDYKGKK